MGKEQEQKSISKSLDANKKLEAEKARLAKVQAEKRKAEGEVQKVEKEEQEKSEKAEEKKRRLRNRMLTMRKSKRRALVMPCPKLRNRSRSQYQSPWMQTRSWKLRKRGWLKCRLRSAKLKGQYRKLKRRNKRDLKRRKKRRKWRNRRQRNEQKMMRN